ncbi:hypothetical protein [Acrocarpospora catenulata]|uniref:hypothetical protein n=1 Tax=Acrocarpospora catenulata TaxID=2836182 RepID=UPI001BDA76EF|nr:hypothetical protein [Acrocarpospora catenulata]
MERRIWDKWSWMHESGELPEENKGYFQRVCEDLFKGGNADLVAHLEDEQVMFVMSAVPRELLDDLYAARRTLPSLASASLQTFFRQVAVTIQRLNAEMEPLSTGPLVRVVITTGDLVVCVAVAFRTMIVAVTFRPETGLALDAQVSALGDALDRDRGKNPDLRGGDRALEADLDRRPESVRGRPVRERRNAELAARVKPLCDESLSLDELQYVAVYRDWEPVYECHLFDAPEMGMQIPHGMAKRWSMRFRDFVPKVQREIGEIGHAMWPWNDQGVDRLVLDVASGAWFIKAIALSDSGEDELVHLIGVTLNQRKVAASDEEFSKLTVAIQGRLRFFFDKEPEVGSQLR